MMNQEKFLSSSKYGISTCLFVSLSICPSAITCELWKCLTEFLETWYECHATRGQKISTISNTNMTALQTWEVGLT
jgi:hypothetical protein